MSLDSVGPSGNGGGTVASRMTHSLSTPSGVDGSASTMSRGGKKLAIRVQMLDDSVTLFQVQVSPNSEPSVFPFDVLSSDCIIDAPCSRHVAHATEAQTPVITTPNCGLHSVEWRLAPEVNCSQRRALAHDCGSLFTLKSMERRFGVATLVRCDGRCNHKRVETINLALDFYGQRKQRKMLLFRSRAS